MREIHIIKANVFTYFVKVQRICNTNLDAKLSNIFSNSFVSRKAYFFPNLVNNNFIQAFLRYLSINYLKNVNHTAVMNTK